MPQVTSREPKAEIPTELPPLQRYTQDIRRCKFDSSASWSIHSRTFGFCSSTRFLGKKVCRCRAIWRNRHPYSTRHCTGRPDRKRAFAALWPIIQNKFERAMSTPAGRGISTSLRAFYGKANGTIYLAVFMLFSAGRLTCFRLAVENVEERE